MNIQSTTTAPAVVDKATYAARWNVSPQTVSRLINKGLPVVRLGHRTLRINPLSADAWLSKHFAVAASK